MKKKNTGLLLAGIILGLCTITAIEPVYSKNSARTEQEITEPESSSSVETVKDEEISQEDIKVNRDTLDKASELMAQKDFEGALPYLNAYIEAKPKKYQGYKLRGEAYYALRRYNEAVKDFQQAVDIKTSDDKFATGTKVFSAVVLGADKQEQYQNPELGILYGELMYAQKAVNDNMYEVSYKKAMEYNSHQYLPEPKKSEISKINCPQKYGKVFNPQGIDADISLVTEDIENGKYTEAVYTVPKITSQYPDYYLGHYLTGVVMSGLEQKEQAVSSFERAIALNPYDFESYASLGLLYYREAEKTFDTSNSDKSVSYFQKAISMNPNCNTYYYYIGLNRMIEGDYADAVDNFKKAIQIKSNDYNSKYYKAVAQYLNGDYNGTIDEATGLIYRRVSNYNSVLYLRALAYFKLKDYNSSIADIEKIHHNMDDIYNADVKKLSAKEQTLECYLYYLQSKIEKANGTGAKSDLAKAYQNPVIALLDKRSRDFGSVNYKLTSFDVDTQYDYLRTTFDNLGVGFEYLNPDYKIVQKTVKKPVAADSSVNTAEPVKETAEQSEPDEIVAPSQRLVLPVNNTQEKELTADLKDEKSDELNLPVNNENTDNSVTAALKEIEAVQKEEVTEISQELEKTVPKKEKDVSLDNIKPEEIQSDSVIPDALAEAKDTVKNTEKPVIRTNGEKSAVVDFAAETVKNSAEQVNKTTAAENIQDVTKAVSGENVEIEEIPAAEKVIHSATPETLNQTVSDEVELPQDSLKQKITEKYGEKVVSTPAKTEFTPLKKSKPVMVFDPDTLIFSMPDESEAFENALTPDNSEKIKTLLDNESHVTKILDNTAPAAGNKAGTVQTQSKQDKIVTDTEIPEVNEKLAQIKEKTVLEDVKPVAEITEKERTPEILEPAVQSVKEDVKKDLVKPVEDVLPAVSQDKMPVQKQDINTKKDVEKLSDIEDSPTVTDFVQQEPVTKTSGNKEKHKLQNLVKDKSADNVVSAEEETQEEAPAVKNYVVDVSQTSKSLKVPVNEKHADVNLAEFNVKNKTQPDIKDGDEVIFLDTTSDSFMQRAEKQMNDNYEKMLHSAPDTTAESAQQSTDSESTGKNEDSVAAKKNDKSAKETAVNINKDTDSIEKNADVQTVPEPEIQEIQEIVVPKVETSGKSDVNAAKSEVSETVSSAADDIKDTETPLPELRGVDETQAGEDNASVQTTSVKQKKKKKEKTVMTDDNVVIAAGGYPESYIAEDEKLTQTKDKKQKKAKKAKAADIEDNAADVPVEDVPTAVSETPVSQEKVKTVETDTKSAAKAKKETKPVKAVVEPPAAEAETAEKANAEADNPDKQPAAETNSEEQSENETKAEKPKKQSFFKRLFSRKKAKTKDLESAPVPEITETNDTVDDAGKSAPKETTAAPEENAVKE